MTDNPIIDTLAPGIILQGDNGVSTGARVIDCKPSLAYDVNSVIVCHAPNSTAKPYVVWTYNHDSGRCLTGHYFETESEAMERFHSRNW